MTGIRPALVSSLPLVGAAACWGLGTVMTKHALGGVPPFTLAVVQLAASSLLLWLVVLFQGLRLTNRRQAARLALTGLLEPGFTITFGVLGLQWTTASMTTLIFAAQPALVVVLAWLLIGERLSRPLLGLAVVAALGVALVAGTDARGGGNGTLAGNLLIGVSLVSCTLYLVWSRRWVAHIHPVLLVALQLTVGLAWTLAIWPLEASRIDFGALRALDPAVWAWAALSGAVYYGLGFWLYIAGLKRAPAGRAALFISLTPLFGVGGATALLGERMMPAQWVGAAIIVAAVLAISRLDTPEPQERTVPAAVIPNP
jgi:drug/metabolite transporter (DMT)-like permease